MPSLTPTTTRYPPRIQPSHVYYFDRWKESVFHDASKNTDSPAFPTHNNEVFTSFFFLWTQSKKIAWKSELQLYERFFVLVCLLFVLTCFFFLRTSSVCLSTSLTNNNTTASMKKEERGSWRSWKRHRENQEKQSLIKERLEIESLVLLVHTHNQPSHQRWVQLLLPRREALYECFIHVNYSSIGATRFSADQSKSWRPGILNVSQQQTKKTQTWN